MSGFFSREETEVKTPVRRVTGCGACKLHRESTTPRMAPAGRGEKGILIIDEAPSPTEDATGVANSGESGTLLRRELRSIGIDLDRDCVKINAVCCKPKEDRAPTPLEIDCCRPLVWKEIEDFKPKLIILLGGGAVNSFLSHRYPNDIGGINKWRGWTIPDRDTRCWVCPVFTPLSVTKGNNPAMETVWEQDLKRAIGMMKQPLPAFRSEPDMIEIVEDDRDLCHKLSSILEWGCRIAFDYETTGLKPHREGHAIVSASIAMRGESAFSFMMPEEGTKARSLLRRIMMTPEIPKMAHNMKFEDNWTNVRLPCTIEGWEWDSCLAAHILDNREGVTGLKFQAYVHFGVMDYSSHLDYLLKSVDGKANGFNRIYQIPKRDLLIYNGIDSMLEFRLAIKQMAELNYTPKRGCDCAC